MRVLMLTYEVRGAGGSYVRCHSLAEALVSLGHEVTIWCAGCEATAGTAQTVTGEGVRVLGFPGVLPRKLRHGGIDPVELVWRLHRAGREPFDLVHGFGHRPTVSWSADRVRRRLAVPYLADWADLWNMEGIGDLRKGLSRAVLGRADHLWEPQVYRWADAVTVITADLARRARALGIPPERIHLCRVGANIDAVHPLDRNAMRARHGLPAGDPMVCYLGFNCCDAELLGLSFVELTRRLPEVRLLLIGSDIPELDAVIQAAGLAARVHRTGAVPIEKLSEHLACADVMLLPYLDRPINRGRYPNKLGDYMAAGRPTVTNPTGDLGDLVADTGCGLLAGESPAAFADATYSLLRDPELAGRLGSQARRAAEDQVSWRALAIDLAAFYERTLVRAPRYHCW